MTPSQTQSSDGFTAVPSQLKVSQVEQKILRFWKQEQIFEKSLQKPAPRGVYSFYDGPPFATGLPHYGHLLTGVLKDIVPRYWTMKGYRVPRRFGWDCHGLPIEQEINKKFQLSHRKDIFEFGVARYNAECRAIVNRYTAEWKATIERVGRWVDMDRAYYTMDRDFMNSVWWVFKELWNKQLIYQGQKVVPYSVGLSTPLSNFEANLNYKEVQDPSLMVSFPLKDQPDCALVAWTTTPWTLPSNMALAVGPEIAYVVVRVKESKQTFVVGALLVESVFAGSGFTVETVEPIAVERLLGQAYLPVFDSFASESARGAFRVISSDHVTVDAGTGIVHLAPAFGEEDFYACQKHHVPLVNPVDDDGCFTAEVPEFQGQRVRDAEKALIQSLKDRKRLFKQATLQHSYPFCWRTDTPLIYRSVSSWFVAVEKIKDQLVAENLKVRWVPDHLREGRFGKWLENARDWAISRNRFWGTPLPVWANAEGEMICVGSHAELEALAGYKIEDLHGDALQEVYLPSPTGQSRLQRVEGVLDCWFESGAMPVAQWGYPRQNAQAFQEAFPADFIAEGLDQTRGWFYTLMVLGVALFEKAPFKNIVVSGLILAEDGKKMSKSLKNYPDPQLILEQHGADALRLYLIDSPVVKAQELRFSELGVKEMVRKVLLRWWNAYGFFVNYARVDHFHPTQGAENLGSAATLSSSSSSSPNLLDHWILSRLHSLISKTEHEMAHYRLDQVVPGLLQFVEDLTNTYIRFNRTHFWQEGMPLEKQQAYETLFEVLVTFSKVMAPFAPFLAEEMFQNLKCFLPGASQSVHLEDFPQARPGLIRTELEASVAVMESLMMLGRNFREKIGVKAKIPLKKMTLIHRNCELLEGLKRFQAYFQEELNVREIAYDANEDQYIEITAKANFPLLGKRLGKKMKAVAQAIAELTLEPLLELERTQIAVVCGETIRLQEVEIRRQPRAQHPHVACNQVISLELDTEVTPEQEQEGVAREIIRKVQAARKNADLILDDRIVLQLGGGVSLQQAVLVHQARIASETLAAVVKWSGKPSGQFCESVLLDEETLHIGIEVMSRGGQ